MKRRKGKKKRADGDGAVYKLPDGSYRGFVTLGYDAKTGKRKRKYVRGKNETEVRAKLRNLLSESNNRVISTPEKVTLGEWLERYAKHRAQDVRPSTRSNHQHYVSRITNVLGVLPLHKLTAYHVRDFYSQLTKERLSPSVRQHIHDFLKSALRDAERMIENYRSPMGAIDRPKGGRLKDPEVWEQLEVQRFLNVIGGHRFYGFFYFTLTQGLRIGEVLALKWSDLKENVLQIQRTVTLDEGKITVGPPKTERGYRTLYLKQDALDVLKQRREEQRLERDLAPSWESSDYIFSTKVGTLTYPNNVRRLYKLVLAKLFFYDFFWNVICLKAGYWQLFKHYIGLRYIRIHDQRHTYITTARDKGIDLEVVADRAGQDPRVTASVYSHVTEARKKKAALSGDELYDLEINNDD
jgi:integrase